MTTKQLLKKLAAFLFVLVSATQFDACTKGSQTSNGSTGTPADTYGTLIYGYGPYGTGMGRLYAIDLDSGRLAWTSPAFVYDINAMLYEDGIIYTCNVNGATAIESKTGKVKWTTNLTGYNYSQSPVNHANCPVLKDSLLYFIGFYGTSENVGLNCLNKNSGALVWKQNLTQGVSAEWTYSTPAVVGDKIVAISHADREPNRIHCLNRFTGEELWRDVSTPGELWDNPMALDSNTVLFGSKERIVWKVSVREKAVSNWAFMSSVDQLSYGATMLLKNQKLYVGGTNGIVAVNPASGQIINTLKDSTGSYTIADNSVFIQKWLGKIQANDLNSYVKKWSWRSPLAAYADTAQHDFLLGQMHSFLVSDGRIVCYSESYLNPPAIRLNSFYVLDATTGKLMKEVKRPFLPDSIPTDHQMLLRNGQAYYTLCTRKFP